MDGEGFIGELTLDVDFNPGDTGTITGGATGFQHETQGAYTGSLLLNQGFVLPGAPGAGDAVAVAGGLSGTLSNGGTDYATDIQLEGSFYGGAPADIPTVVGGYSYGEVGVGLDNFEGAFVATN